MNVVETLLIFVGLPLAGFVILFSLVYGRTMVHQNRYRPGRAWTHAPVWYMPHSAPPPEPAPGSAPALPAGSGPRFADDTRPAVAGSYGGATGEW